jgi:ubiquinone/menaquinone biosynthesis C-methylase UbiE
MSPPGRPEGEYRSAQHEGSRVSADRDVSRHYSRGDLLERLYAALGEDGVDRGRASIETLAPYDQFHGRGLEATVAIADALEIGASDHLLDIGSGIGGPARYFAHRFGCKVTGIDLTTEFCTVADELTRLLGLDGNVGFEVGDALAMPFATGGFDGAYSMNVSMNIADKGELYREIHRVLKPGGWLMLSEIAKDAGADPDYPTPWAASAHTSFLSTPEETQRGLAEAGFEVVWLRATREEALAFGARSRAMVERGEKPPHRAVMLIHGDIATKAMANTARALAEARIVPIEVLGRKRR